MGMEDTIRKIHRFKNQINDFNRRASGLIGDELEIVMARLVDMMEEDKSELNILDKKFKGMLVKKVHELRLQGIVPNKFIRFKVSFDGIEFALTFLSHYKFAYPAPLHENTITEWANGSVETWQKLLSDGN